MDRSYEQVLELTSELNQPRKLQDSGTNNEILCPQFQKHHRADHGQAKKLTSESGSTKFWTAI
jgi:hypothetical protein